MKKSYQSMLLLISVTAAFSLTLLSCDSYERKMARLEKVATEFKATLSPNNQILAERIDSTAQKVFYLEPDKEGYGDVSIKNIKVHDYTTNETISVLPESGSIEDFEFCGIEYRDSKVIKDRLFIKLQSDCMWRLGSTGVFYVNVRDNSLHYVESCDDATFLEKGEIIIRKFYYLGEDDEDYGGEKTEMKEYTLLTSLSDEAYADNRREQKRTEERLAEEWRNRPIERRIFVSFNVDSHRKPINVRTEGCAGIIQDYFLPYRFCTADITVPEGKIWMYNKRYAKGCHAFWLMHMHGQNSSKYDSEEFKREGTYIIRGGRTFRILFDRKDSGNYGKTNEEYMLDVYFTEKNE